MGTLQHLTNERGVGLFATAIISVALIAATAIGVGIGRHAFTATEVQAVADAAATAAAQGRMEPGHTNADGELAAQHVALKNQVDGAKASIDPSQLMIEFGNFNEGIFTKDLEPVNAARATAKATVPNLFPVSIPGVFNLRADANGNYTVTKQAVAVFTSVGGASPTLPLAICAACFSSSCINPDQSCLPLTQTNNNENTSAWTGYFGGASTSAIKDYIAAPCGGGVPAPMINAGTDSINTSNGQTNLAGDVFCLYCQMGIQTFLVPVIECPGNGCGSSLSQSFPVVGFATISLDPNAPFHCSSGQGGFACDCKNAKGKVDAVNFLELFRSDVTGPPGDPNQGFGSGFVVLAG